MKFSGKNIREFFFRAVEDGEPDAYFCNKCKGRYKSPKGYTNLTNHVHKCYGNGWEARLQEHLEKHCIDQKIMKADGTIKESTVSQSVMKSFYSSNNKELRAYQWIKWLALRNMPLVEIENELTRSMVKIEPFTAKTIRKYIIATAKETEKAIAAELKEAGKITLLMDGWTCDGASTHYIAIFAGYQHPKTKEYNEVLMALSPSLEEDDLGADAHIALFEQTLELYQIPKDNVACIIGDNCSTNKAISTRWNIPMVGCASHRLNLAVKQWIEEQPGVADAIEKVSILMSKASNLKTAARLRELTMAHHGVSLKAIKENVTRWTSVFSMVKRYLRIKKQLDDCEGLEEYALTKSEQRVITKVKEDFEIFNIVTTELQGKGVDLVHVRIQFNTLLSEPRYSSMLHYLKSNAEIVHSKDFESGVRKILQGIPYNGHFSDEEKAAVERLIDRKKLLAQQEAQNVQNERALTLREKLALNMKKRKRGDHHDATEDVVRGVGVPGNNDAATVGPPYVDVGKLICATSNCCERLFSEAKYIMLPHRRSMSPIVFEALLYLKKNIKFWNVQTVGQAMKAMVSSDEANN